MRCDIGRERKRSIRFWSAWSHNISRLAKKSLRHIHKSQRQMRHTWMGGSLKHQTLYTTENRGEFYWKTAVYLRIVLTEFFFFFWIDSTNPYSSNRGFTLVSLPGSRIERSTRENNSDCSQHKIYESNAQQESAGLKQTFGRTTAESEFDHVVKMRDT